MGKDLTTHGDGNLRIRHVSGGTHHASRFELLAISRQLSALLSLAPCLSAPAFNTPLASRLPPHASRCLGILALGTMLTACVMPRTAEGPLHTYLLSPEKGTWATQSSGNKHEAHGVLLLSAPQAEAGFDTPRMVYLTRPHEVSYYATNQWAETPARMMWTVLTQSLEKNGLWKAVVPIPSSVRGDYRLDTQGLVLQQEFSQSPSQVRVGFRLQLVRLHEQVVVGTRRFEVVENAPTDDAYGGVLAANRALATLLDQVTTWLTSCLNEGSPGRC
jgi:cholesterol transport system auxiliary component